MTWCQLRFIAPTSRSTTDSIPCTKATSAGSIPHVLLLEPRRCCGVLTSRFRESLSGRPRVTDRPSCSRRTPAASHRKLQESFRKAGAGGWGAVRCACAVLCPRNEVYDLTARYGLTHYKNDTAFQ